MKKLKLLILILCCSPLYGIGQQVPKDSARVEIFYTKEMSKSFENISFIPSIDITPEGFILLASPNQFYILGWGGMLPLSETMNKPIHSFTKTSDNAIVFVQEKEFCYLDTLGRAVKLFNLPDNDMKISTGKEVLYLYGKNKSINKYVIYMLFKGAKYTSLLEYPFPITSVLETNGNLLFSSKNKILLVNIEGKQINELLSLPDENDKIISIGNDNIHDILYFSTDNAIYRIKSNNIELVSKDFGGILKYDGEGLLVFNPEKQLIIRLRNNILYPVEKDLSQIKLSIDATPENENLTRLLNEPRSLILAGQIPKAIQAYAQLVGKDETNSALLSEYAYALALGGVYEGALMNLDRAKLFGAFSAKDNFYAGQVFALMGYNRPAAELLTQCSVPKWIYRKYDEFYKNYKSNSLMTQGNSLKNSFNRANYLASYGMNYQSIALYERILTENSDVYLFHAGYSIPLEKAGLNKLASDELQTGILLMGNDSELNEAKQAFNQRLAQLKQQPENASTEEQPELIKTATKFRPQTMLYVGGMFSENYTSFNSRFGAYFSNSSNCSLNLGISGTSTTTNFNVGFSGYQRIGNVLILGLGLNDQIGGSSNVLSIVPSLGFSFINSEKNSSWDVFFNLYSPLQEGASTIFGISIGKSFYWGKR